MRQARPWKTQPRSPPPAGTWLRRIQRFLAAKRDGVLTAGKATNITAALTFLESGRYADGEDAMMLAEKDWPPRGEVGKAVPVEVLADRLAGLLRV